MSTPHAHFQRYRLKLLPLCPVHVGSGNSVEPFEYRIEHRAGVPVLQTYDLDQLLSSLNPIQRDEFNRLTGQNYKQLRSWLRNQFQPADEKFGIALSPTAANELGKSLDDPNRSGEVELLCRNGIDHRPYLPGSSIKGAIRTALLDAAVGATSEAKKNLLLTVQKEVMRERAPGRQLGLEQQFQATALDYLAPNGRSPDLHHDPFRQFAISDVILPRDYTYIERVQISKDRSAALQDAGKILMYREVTHSRLVFADSCASVEAELRLYPEMCDRKWGDKGLRHRFSWRDICDRCNAFYQPRFTNELDVHVTNKQDSIIRQRLNQFLETIGPEQCLVRIGRHSHFECVTVSPPYNVEPKRGCGKTRSYLTGTQPLGWARLSVEPV